MPTVNTYVEVDVDVSLDDFYDSDIIDECEKRGLYPIQDSLYIRQFYERYRCGTVSASEIIEFVDQIIYMTLGKII